MVALDAPVCDFGWNASDFNLPGVDGTMHGLTDIAGQNGTLLMFICNHCPYVKAIVSKLVSDCEILQTAGIGIAAISSNDAATYPADSFDNMKVFALENDFTFPYLYDETQAIARAYRAVCTPDFFGFNRDLQLQYRGRFDSSGSNFEASASHPDLREAMLQVCATGTGPSNQIASIGCSIKWTG